MLQDQSASGVSPPIPVLVAVDGGRTVPIDQPVLLIGRSKRRAHFRINDPFVSSVHCEIHSKDGELSVRDCSRHGTRINGRAVDEAVLIDGDILQIVKHRFRVETGLPPAPRPDHDEERFSSKEKGRKRRHSGPVVRDGWFVRMAGVELGPMPWSEIVDMVNNHEVTRADEVRQEFETDWKLIDAVGGLFPSELQGLTNPPSTATETATWESAQPLITGDPDSDSPAPEVVPAAGVTSEASSQQNASAEDESTDQKAIDDESADELIDLDVETDLSEVESAPVAEQQPAVSGDQATGRPPLGYEPDPSNPRYFMRRKGREFGPLEFEKLQRLATEGRLSQLDSIRTDVNPDWVSAAMVENLFLEGGSRDLSDEGYAANLLAELDATDKAAVSTTEIPDDVVPEANAPATASLPDTPPAAGYSIPAAALVSLPPLPVPQAYDDTTRKMSGDVLAPLIYIRSKLRTVPAMTACSVAGILFIYMLIPSFDGSVVLGRVTLDGQPLQEASITFTDRSAGVEASGLLNKDGTYVVTTMEGGMATGTYTVTFMPLSPEPQEVIEELQRQYRATQGVGGAFAQYQELNADDPATNQRPAGPLPAGTIPFRYRSPDTSGLKVDVVDGRNEFPFDLASKN